jgi:hypothetical protein
MRLREPSSCVKISLGFQPVYGAELTDKELDAYLNLIKRSGEGGVTYL